MTSFRWMARSVRPFAAAAILMAAVTPAKAHFIWAQIEQSGQKSVLRVTFGENAAEKTLPDLLPRVKIQQVKVGGGGTTTLSTGDGALLGDLTAGTRTAGVSQVWGVLDRSDAGRGIFLLDYYAKAATSAAASGERINLHAEICMQKQGDMWVATAYHGKKGEPGAEFTIELPGVKEPVVLKADDKGEVKFTLAGSGVCSMRATFAEKESGTFDGKAFETKRYYTTLSFPVNEGPAVGKPAATPSSLMADAHAARLNFPADFKGFEAKLTVDDNGTPTPGTLKYSGGKVTVEVPGASEELRRWVDAQMTSLISHRQASASTDNEARWKSVTFTGVDAGNGLGQQIDLHDNMKSLYRVRDNQILEVTRTMGDQRFSITVMENLKTPEGKFYPKHFAVTYFNAVSGNLLRSEYFTDNYKAIGNIYVPASRRVVFAKEGKIATREITVTEPKLYQ